MPAYDRMPFLYRRFFIGAILLLNAAGASIAQNQVSRDVRAVAALQQSFSALGGRIPSDSLVSGQVEINAGALTEQGTIRILTKGFDQSSEIIELGRGIEWYVYSKGRAAVEKSRVPRKRQSLEWAATAQTGMAPWTFATALLSSGDFSVEYVGLDNSANTPTHHVRFWNTYTFNGELTHLADFSRRELWIDTQSGLPIRVRFEQREGGGSSDRIRVEIRWSDYRTFGNLIYPTKIEKYLNGTLYLTATIDKVSSNVGLTDLDFQIPAVRP